MLNSIMRIVLVGALLTPTTYGQDLKLATPALSAVAGHYETAPADSGGMSQVLAQFKFGDIGPGAVGCTVQAMTTIDGIEYLSLGKAVPIKVVPNSIQALTVTETTPVPGAVQVTLPSSTDVINFGIKTKFSIRCTSYAKDPTKTVVSLIFT